MYQRHEGKKKIYQAPYSIIICMLQHAGAKNSKGDGWKGRLDGLCLWHFFRRILFMPLLHQLKNLHTSVVSLVCLFICCIIISIDYEVLVM